MVGSGGWFDGAEGVAWPCDKETESAANKHHAGLSFR